MKICCTLHLFALVGITWYKADITRNSCRKDGLFKLINGNIRLDATALKTVKVKSLVFCAKECLDTSTCRSFNYKQSTRMCVVFASNKATNGSMISSDGWNYYEPVRKWVSHRYVKSHWPLQYTYLQIYLWMQVALEELKAAFDSQGRFSARYLCVLTYKLFDRDRRRWVWW